MGTGGAGRPADTTERNEVTSMGMNNPTLESIKRLTFIDGVVSTLMIMAKDNTVTRFEDLEKLQHDVTINIEAVCACLLRQGEELDRLRVELEAGEEDTRGCFSDESPTPAP